MAPPQILSRSQRRHEQKQNVLVLALVVVVALLSFLAGIVVGRGLSRPEPVAVTSAPASTPRLPVPPPAPPVAAATQENPALPTAASTSTRPEQLAFYDSLAKGEQPPLGSGINLPPPGTVPPPEPLADAGEKPTPVAAATSVSKSPAPPPKTPAAATKSPPSATLATGKTTVATNPSPAGKSPTKAVTTTSYVIQAASFSKAKEAADLSRKLSRKGYTPFVEAVDLGSKGQWHRVYVGPFSNVAAADKVAKRLKSEERLAPVVRKR